MSTHNKGACLTLKELFTKWNVPDAVTITFIDNGITLQFLKTLSADLLKKLCPDEGMRIYLKKHIDDFVIPNQ
ncbi:hypothetical protein KQX54_000122, partial [Cotesia glomerata]